MPFTPEDGTGLAAANSYISTAFFDSYFADRGVDVSAATTTQKEQACVRATDYIDKRFGRKFRGCKETKAQALEWPRLDAYDNDDYSWDGIPAPLQKATAEYAWRAYNLGELAPDPALPFSTRDTLGLGTTESAGIVKSKKEKVGPIEEENEYHDTNSMSSNSAKGSSQVEGFLIPAYPAADLMIEELLKSSSSRDMLRA